jgi:hypothetical protein
MCRSYLPVESASPFVVYALLPPLPTLKNQSIRKKGSKKGVKKGVEREEIPLAGIPT